MQNPDADEERHLAEEARQRVEEAQRRAERAAQKMEDAMKRAKLAQDDKRKVTFNDVAGADEEKAELQEIVEFLKNPQKFVQIGARIPKGCLLYTSPSPRD